MSTKRPPIARIRPTPGGRLVEQGEAPAQTTTLDQGADRPRVTVTRTAGGLRITATVPRPSKTPRPPD